MLMLLLSFSTAATTLVTCSTFESLLYFAKTPAQTPITTRTAIIIFIFFDI
ncbi:MAG: hypothetical protein ACLT0E_06290 [Eubacterium sp.]|uniref:hypothetical protein n=1 Tax=Eubacterium sp. TaxID=142586 RepID=UPI003A285D59